ncbi:MAG: S1 RNA-binding domain-containing protein [Rubripirellula sp.]|nr:S1 RNA-binding domain-containing protein [Rubripirellula sp.]
MSSGDQAPTDGQEPDHSSTSPASVASEAAEPTAVEASAENHTEATLDATAPGPAQESAGPKPENPLTKRARVAGPLAARGLGVAKPASPSVSTEDLEAAGQAGAAKPAKGKSGNKKSTPRPRLAGDKPKPKRPQQAPTSKVAIPNTRHALPDDIQAELDAELAATDVEAMLSGPAGMANRAEPLSEGVSVQGQVLKIHDDNVFVALGGPDEGVVAFDQFEQEPAIGDSVEVLVRGISKEDGLYALGLPGSAIEASDWEDIDEGSVVEVTVTGSNSGGLECKVGGAKGFIPISQISEYRVEDTTEFVDQKFRCVVTESSQKRGNLVLSRRAILEREREEKRKEQLEQIEVGDELQGTVRTIKDFGAFVDLGGLDGLIHISKLSWDRVKHPSEVLEIGQQVTVKLDSVDKETGKISLSYRDLLENPWDTAEQEFEVGSVHKGSVTRIAAFGCFVRLAAGVEGLVHISELAHHRVSKVGAFISEGEEVEVKILSFDRDAQKVSLSIKAAQQAPVDPTKQTDKEEVE